MDLDIATVDRLLTTTRAVRKRLDLLRPVPRSVIEECLRLAVQAPSGGNSQGWRWIVVTDPDTRAKLAELYRRGAQAYLDAWPAKGERNELSSAQARMISSAVHLRDHLHEVPVHVIPCVHEVEPSGLRVPPIGLYGSLFPAIWSFQLALRSRGLGSVITSFHLGGGGDREAAALLGIPDGVAQAGLIPVAYYTGATFSPAERRPAEEVTYWESWGGRV